MIDPDDFAAVTLILGVTFIGIMAVSRAVLWLAHRALDNPRDDLD